MDARSVIRTVLGSAFVEGTIYPVPLAPEVAEWYCYVTDAGHCVVAAVRTCLTAAAEPWEAMVPIPVRTFLRPTTRRAYQDGYWVVDLPYDEDSGLVTPEEDEEFEPTRTGAAAIWCRNDGPLITETNFFYSPWAQAGIIYLSFNRRTARLLLPDALRNEVEQLEGTDHVVISKGTWHVPLLTTEDGLFKQPPPRRDALELMFEDGSQSPYVIHLSRPQYDPSPAKSDRGRTDLELLVYTAGPELRLRFPARYRSVARLPNLRPWR